jgi:hypothetical protein
VRTDLRGLAVLAILAIAGCGTPAISGPPPSPVVTCTGIPEARCDEALESVAISLPNTTPATIEVLCVSGTCTEEAGAMDTVVTLADGSQLRSTTMSWSQAAAPVPGGKPLPAPAEPAPAEPAPAEPAEPPAVPVEPRCQGVPVAWCRTMAETAFGEVSAIDVVTIVVRCTEQPCTDDHGIGETLVSYSDGSIRTSSWEYAGG